MPEPTAKGAIRATSARDVVATYLEKLLGSDEAVYNRADRLISDLFDAGWAFARREDQVLMPDAFVLQRDEDVTGVSGTGVVAEGVEFTDGTVALRWTSEWPTSVVFHDRGMESVRHVHGHDGRTRIIWRHDAS